MTLRSRSCPTCHSIGEPYVIDRTLGSNEPIRCKNLWHIEVREPEVAYPEEPLTTEELALAEHFRHLDCGQVVDPVDLEDCGGMAVEILRFLSARGWREPELQAQPERTGRGRFEELLTADHLTADPERPAPAQQPEAVPEARAVPIEDFIEEISAADPEFRAAVERTERESLRSENTRLRDLVRRYEGTGNDAKLTYAELESERDRLALDLYRAQDCGHDLERFDAQTIAFTRIRKILDLLRQPGGTVSNEVTAQLLDTALGDAPGPAGMDPAEFTAVERLAGDVAALAAERDRLAEFVRRWEPVIEAAKAWVSPKGSTVEIDNAFNALEDAIEALGDVPDPDESQPMFGKVSEEDMRSVAWTSGSGIDSADLRVEPEDESGGSSTADPTSPTDAESGQRGRDEGDDRG